MAPANWRKSGVLCKAPGLPLQNEHRDESFMEFMKRNKGKFRMNRSEKGGGEEKGRQDEEKEGPKTAATGQAATRQAGKGGPYLTKKRVVLTRS